MQDQFIPKAVRVPAKLMAKIDAHIETAKRRGEDLDFSKFARRAMRAHLASRTVRLTARTT